MLPLSLRIAAAASALALGAGVATAPTASATSGARLGVSTALREASTPVATVGTSWAQSRHAALAALARAQARLTTRTDPSATRPATVHRPDLTLILRDLRAGLPFLEAADRTAARRILSRPSDGPDDLNGDGYWRSSTRHRSCTPVLCVWWVTNTNAKDPNPVPTVDSDHNGVPDQVDLTKSVMSSVWDRIVTRGGYRAPLPDGRLGSDDRFDVYLADIGDEGLFGYCAPELAGPGTSASGYCVLDNDYSKDEFGTSQTPADNLKVTAAHEFFHAVQFAYDVAEDDWFMEGTAMWMEDEMYDDVNDNVRYLQGSQLTSPTRSLDRPAAGLGGPYVSWIFWRYLSEAFPDSGDTGLPLVLRDVWRRAQGSTSAQPATYSMRALALALRARGTSLPTVFAHFGEANTHARQAYAEGAEQRYPVVRPVAAYTLSSTRRSITAKVATMAHMTNYTVRFTPGAGLTSSPWRLRVPIDMPSYSRGSRAQVSVVMTDGSRSRRAVALDASGNGVAFAPFSRATVARVELTLTNAGQRYRCHRGTYLSCQGSSLDDGLRSSFRAGVSRG